MLRACIIPPVVFWDGISMLINAGGKNTMQLLSTYIPLRHFYHRPCLKILAGVMLFLVMAGVACAGMADAAPAAPPEKHLPEARLEVRRVQGVAFGGFTVGKGGGAIIIRAEGGAHEQQGQVTFLDARYHPALYEVRGTPGMEFSIVLPEEVRLARHARGAGGDSGEVEVTLRKLESSPSGRGSIGQDGTARITVGGMLVLPARPPSGSYDGLFDIDVRKVE